VHVRGTPVQRGSLDVKLTTCVPVDGPIKAIVIPLVAAEM
jgi:hypothetical protein